MRPTLFLMLAAWTAATAGGLMSAHLTIAAASAAESQEDFASPAPPGPPPAPTPRVRRVVRLPAPAGLRAAS